MDIAILGATGHIAQCVFYCFSNGGNNNFILSSRNRSGLINIYGNLAGDNIKFIEYDQFYDYHYDVILNCVGIGNPAVFKNQYVEIFNVTEKYDNICLDYLKKNRKAIYINFSTGALYGDSFKEPVDYGSSSKIDINNFDIGDYYRIAKMNAEAKHRAMWEYNIVDLRIFGFFSRFIDINYSFFMCDVVRCIKNSQLLKTNEHNIVRDYIHLKDFQNLLILLAGMDKINKVIDVRSSRPVKKFDILAYFKADCGLVYEMESNMQNTSATGLKYNYYSIRDNGIGFKPMYTSMECIVDEYRYLAGK